MLEAKLAGQEIVEPEPAPEEAPAIDLVEALKQSIAAAKPRRRSPLHAVARPPRANWAGGF